jgi:hypothetical protein
MPSLICVTYDVKPDTQYETRLVANSNQHGYEKRELFPVSMGGISAYDTTTNTIVLLNYLK